MTVALFVEGSAAPPDARLAPPQHRLWNDLISTLLGVSRFDLIVPISKKHLLAMDPALPKMSGAAEALDQLIARTHRARPFDAAIVAWDLSPAWNSGGTFCRRHEVQRCYELLSQSANLPQPWRDAALAALDDVTNRARTAQRRPPLARHQILAVCMEPMFESLLCQDEGSIRRALDLAGQPRPNGWPTNGWGDPTFLQPDTRLLGRAIAAYRSTRHAPRPVVLRQIRGDYRTAKDAWAAHLLARMLQDPAARPVIEAHPLIQRLREWCPIN